VGLQGSGKTTYLAVLYDLLRDDRGAPDVATVRDPDQQDYLGEMLKAIRSGERVPKNDPSQPIERIAFEIISGHRRIDVATFDYAGENTQARRQRELKGELHGVDGILLFLPPSAVRGGEEEEETNKAVQKLFGDLAELKKRVHAVDVIAVVITKADELKRISDCDVEAVEAVVEQEYSKHLQQLRARTRRCKVFVTSALGDRFRFTDPPTEQPLEPYGVVESFRWLLDTASLMRRRRVFRRNLLSCLMTGVLFVLAAAGMRWHEHGLFEEMQTRAALLEASENAAPVDVLRHAADCVRALDDYCSWHNLWPRRSDAVARIRGTARIQCIEARQALQRAMAEVDRSEMIEDSFREVGPLLEWYPEQAEIFRAWYEDRKLQTDAKALLEDLAGIAEDSIPLLKTKITRVRDFVARYARAADLRPLTSELHRLEAELTRLTVAADFDALVNEIHRQKSPMQRYLICSKAAEDVRWAPKQQKTLAEMVTRLRSDAADAEWSEIQAFDRDWPRKYSDRIARREGFQKHFPDIAKAKACATAINELLSDWDRWEYESIRAALEQDPVDGVDAVAGLCRDYRDNGRPKKDFLSVVDPYLQWYEGLKKRQMYQARVSQLKVTRSEITDNDAANREVQVAVAVRNVRKSSVKKKTGRDGVAYDLGAVAVPWQMNDPITVEVTCFHWGDETVKKTFDGRAALAYLAGKKCAALPQGVEVWFAPQSQGAWFDFPPAKEIRGE